MPSSQAIVATEAPFRYMSQLCKHFQHKLPVTLEVDRGSIEFGAGLCTLTMGPEQLTMQVDAADAEGLERLQDVVARHLLRFAFREPPAIVWQPAG